MAIVRILGAGAIGLGLASQMKGVGFEPEFICDAERKERYSSQVFFVNNEPLQIKCVTPETVHEHADLIIVAVKYGHLHEATELLEGSVGPNTVIMSMMNGIDSEMILGDKWGIEKLLHAFIVEIDAVKEKNMLYYTNPGVIVLGDISGKKTLSLEKTVALLESIGVNHRISENIEKDMWWKFMINVGVNQASAVLGAPYRVFKENKFARDIMNDAMEEVIRLSQVMNINLGQSDLDRWYQVLDKLGSDKKTSMLQDVEAGRKTEVEMFAGTVCALGKKHGVETPANIMLYNMIKAYETMNGIES
ncbi:ketopantoate reductase family protein [Fusibacter sp. JL216-2]|uniref:ketopantoate reductase family protein n=1 Tax=Fusibacter sp. JL216-2 TaxID=3071453 RepID=UPI003D351A0F